MAVSIDYRLGEGTAQGLPEKVGNTPVIVVSGESAVRVGDVAKLPADAARAYRAACADNVPMCD